MIVQLEEVCILQTCVMTTEELEVRKCSPLEELSFQRRSEECTLKPKCKKEEVEVKKVKSQIRKWNEDYAVRGSMYSSNTSSDFQFGRSLQTWKLLCNKMEEEEWKMLSSERWIFERDIQALFGRIAY